MTDEDKVAPARVDLPWNWLLGRNGPPPAKTILTAGPLSVALSELDLLDIRFGATEIVRRLGVRVRDSAWESVPPIQPKIDFEATEGRFRVDIAASHRGDSLGFTWYGTILGEADGSLVYEMEGRALSDCLYNRIGLVVLHPLTLVGCRYWARKGRDVVETGTFPTLIGPQSIVDGVELPLVSAFDHLTIDLSDELSLTLELTGDLFEMEDQRNWTDGSFKTYSTPLAIPVPLALNAGGVIRQRLRLVAKGADTSAAASSVDRRKETTVLAIGRALENGLPPIGVSLDCDGHELDDAELAQLRAMAPAHIRADIDLRSDDAVSSLIRATQAAASLGVPLELALSFPPETDDIGPSLQAAAPILATLPLARLLLLPSGATVTPVSWLAQARHALGTRIAAPLIIGTGADFVELNRRRPPVLDGTGLTYAINPQVHDFDEDALIQSLQGQAETIRTAQFFAPGAPIHVGPITLKPRPQPQSSDPVNGLLPPDVDPRQASRFAAAWTAASVKQLAEAGAVSLTYFEATGWRGVLERTGGSPLPDQFLSRAGVPYPVFHLLTVLGEWCGDGLVACASSDPLRAQALVVSRGRGWGALVSSLTADPQRVVLSGATAGRYLVRRLTQDGWDGVSVLEVGSGEMTLEFGPYDVAIVSSIEAGGGSRDNRVDAPRPA